MPLIRYCSVWNHFQGFAPYSWHESYKNKSQRKGVRLAVSCVALHFRLQWIRGWCLTKTKIIKFARRIEKLGLASSQWTPSNFQIYKSQESTLKWLWLTRWEISVWNAVQQFGRYACVICADKAASVAFILYGRWSTYAGAVPSFQTLEPRELVRTKYLADETWNESALIF